jgi:pyrroloquinoline-quinone synthase
MPDAPHCLAAARAAIAASGLDRNPYLCALEAGRMPLADFRRSQAQFFFAVTFFPRPMAALVGRIADPRARLDILRNLVEEHGDFHEEAFHHTTFQRFLRSIGVDPGALDALALHPGVRAFNSVLSTACVLDELEVGLGCMGVIEQAFAGISARIGGAVVAQGWVAAADLTHYRLHADIDERHAAEFLAVVEPRWADPQRRYLIEQGLRMGAHIFDRLYRDLHAAGAG